MAKQGKCDHCKIRFVWDVERHLPMMTCPECGRPLGRTSEASKLPIKILTLRKRRKAKPQGKPGQYANGRRFYCLVKKKTVDGEQCNHCFHKKPQSFREKYFDSRALCVDKNRRDDNGKTSDQKPAGSQG